MTETAPKLEEKKNGWPFGIKAPEIKLPNLSGELKGFGLALLMGTEILTALEGLKDPRLMGYVGAEVAALLGLILYFTRNNRK